jgi:hypothetical protein
MKVMDNELKDAAKNLFVQMDDCLGDWRNDTLILNEKSDGVNKAWVRLAKVLGERLTDEKEDHE